MTGVVTRATKGVPLTATDHDDNLEVIVSLHKSATAPSPTYGCMLWADTDNDLLKMRNKANDAWITLGALDTTGAFSDNNLTDQDQLSELSDVTITSVADNEVLAYDSTASKWINQTASEAGLATSAQGSLADSALQDGDTVASLTITSADINGGTIDNVTIGGSSAGAGTFTNLTATGTVTLNQSTIDGLTVGQGAGNVSTNTAVGKDALAANTTGAYDTAVGYESLYSNTTGSQNTAIGQGALQTNSTGNYNVAVGRYALVNSTASDNTAVGWQSMYSNTAGTNNTATGNQALEANTTGGSNTALGHQALTSNTTASNNTAVGYQAGYSNQTGTRAVLLGGTAGYNGTAFDGDVIIGFNAGTAQTTGYSNTLIGGRGDTGNNLGAGHQLTTGTYNTFIGGSAGGLMTTGSKNTILGNYSGNQGGLDIRTSSNNIVLSDGDGKPVLISTQDGSVGTNSTSGNAEFVLMRGAVKRWFIWNDAASNNLTICPASFASGVYISQTGTGWGAYSDRRIKSDIVDIDYGLSTVMAMRPRRYTVTANGVNSIGFVAQELKDVLPEAVMGEEIEFSDDDTPQERSSKTMGVVKDTIIPVLVKAIQELEARIAALESN